MSNALLGLVIKKYGLISTIKYALFNIKHNKIVLIKLAA